MWSHLQSVALQLQSLRLSELTTAQAVELLGRGEAIKCVSHPLNPHVVGRSFYRNPRGMWVYTAFSGKWYLMDSPPDDIQHAILTWKKGAQWTCIPKPDVEGN